MSGILSDLLSDLVIKPLRSIAFIIPDVTVREQLNDRLEITRHPVEQGAEISDHAFKQAAEVHAEYGWTNSTLSSLVSGLGEERVLQIYADLLNLQATREPFDLYTGKRAYNNMMITELHVTTDASSEYALAVEMSFREVIIVSTSSATLSDQSSQSIPASTSPQTNTGPVQPRASNNTMLLNWSGSGTGYNQATGSTPIPVTPGG